ncbi:MAG: hypothetical protein ACFFCI_01575 [Promethearchaeota archaeon]
MSVFLLLLGSFFLIPHLPSKEVGVVSFKNQENLNTSAEQWTKRSFTEQWIKNSNFSRSDGWTSEYSGDLTDIENIIENEEAQFKIKGEQEINYEIISGTINNSLTSQGWMNGINPKIPVYPRRIASQPLHEITKDGCWTSHIWNESSGTPLNPFQKVSAQWDKEIMLPHVMYDYIITSASLQVKVNATVRAYPGDGKDPYTPPYPWGGIEVAGDYYSTYFGEGDYLNFYVVLSNRQKNISYTVAEFKPVNLGTDVGQHPYDNITDTIFKPDNMEDLIFYLNQVLQTDFQNFTISVGVEINCEDNLSSDMDIFEDIYIKTCDFNISYVKKIDQLSSGSFKYRGAQIEGNGGIIEVTEALLNFDYKINHPWPTILSPNSEVKIFINNQEYPETVKLSKAEASFKIIKEGGFDVTKLIPTTEGINISIQVFLADEFGLPEEYIISIDNVVLTIKYDLYTYAQQSYLFQILLIIGLVVSGCLAGYFIYYKKVLKFPKIVRKVRKYRKSLKKTIPPDISVKNREILIKSTYKDELGKSASFLKSKPLKTAAVSSKTPKSLPTESKKSDFNKKTLILLFLIILGFMLPFCFLNLGLRIPFTKNITVVNAPQLSQNSALFWTRESKSAQWIKNSEFNNSNFWTYDYEGDSSDVNASIRNDYANFEVIGDSGTQEWVENNPLSGEWIKIDNNDGIPVPEVSQLRESGWFVQHRYVDNALNQSVKVQWQKNFTMNIDMSDFYITDASLEIWINGTVEDQDADSGGIDRPGDTEISTGILQMATGDFARFFMLVSDLQHEREFEAAYYQTDELGRDGPPAITELESTRITPITKDSLIFYLNQAFEKNSREFALTLGISIWCEDSVYATDRDYWNGLWIQNFTLSISYEKKINQFTSASWVYTGDQLKEGDYQIEVTQANLNFDYKVNETWPSVLSPNAEFKIFINNQVHNETIKLHHAKTFFSAIKEEGFDVTKLIPTDDSINVTIQLYLADEFGLNKSIEFSIDNVELWIAYVVIIPLKETLLFQILFSLIVIGASILTTYIVVYKRLLKYPKPVRKVRKYRRTLRMKNDPQVPILGLESAFKGVYRRELGKTADFIKPKPLIEEKGTQDTFGKYNESKLTESKLEQDELIKKSLEHKSVLDKIVDESKKT